MSDHEESEVHEETPQKQKVNLYLRELLAERNSIDQAKYPLLYKLADDEYEKVKSSGKVPFKDNKFVDVYRERPVKLIVKVLVPTKEHPRYNFIGKLLGSKGNTLKQLQEETMCHISICGRGSIRDRQKEEELRQSSEPKYAHLSDDLHVKVSTLGPPAEGHARIAFALAEIRKYLIPEYGGDNSRQEAIMEIMSKPPSMLHDDRLPPRKPGMMRGSGRRPPPHADSSEGPHARHRPPTSRMGPKPKMMSILDRARATMETYDDYDGREYAEYDDYRGGGQSSSGRQSYSRGYADEYEADYYRDSDPYGGSSGDYGYKKRKTYMD